MIQTQFGPQKDKGPVVHWYAGTRDTETHRIESFEHRKHLLLGSLTALGLRKITVRQAEAIFIATGIFGPLQPVQIRVVMMMPLRRRICSSVLDATGLIRLNKMPEMRL